MLPSLERNTRVAQHFELRSDDSAHDGGSSDDDASLRAGARAPPLPEAEPQPGGAHTCLAPRMQLALRASMHACIPASCKASAEAEPRMWGSG
jgi:hypothetical protein